jgi:hypothetical protein
VSGPTEVATAARVEAWRSAPPGVADLDALCRQIDVRHRVSAAYGPDWKKLETETPADAATVAGVVAALLTAAEPGPDGAEDGGRGLKYTNSALKALELADAIPDAPRLRAWALRLLDDRTRSDA